MMQQQYDQTLTFTLPLTKITSIIILDQNLLMLIHHNFQYSILRLTQSQCQGKQQILGYGQLPQLVQQIQKYNRNCVIFINGNRLELYDWVKKQSIIVASIAVSEIKFNKFGYYNGKEYIAYWKQSRFKYSLPLTYQLQILTKPSLSIYKKHRLQYRQPHNFLLTQPQQNNPQLVSFSAQGFTINITYLQQNISHDINSIYKLMVVQKRVQGNSNNNRVFIGVTHGELGEGSIIQYQVSPYHITKTYKKALPPNTLNYNKYYSIETPNLIKKYSKNSKNTDVNNNNDDTSRTQIIVKIKYKFKVKMLMMLMQVMMGNISQCQEQQNCKVEKQYVQNGQIVQNQTNIQTNLIQNNKISKDNNLLVQFIKQFISMLQQQ